MIFPYLITSCQYQNYGSEYINKFILTYNLPVVKLTGELQNVTDKLIIYTKNDLTVYAFPYHYSIDDGNKLIFEEIKFKYFMFKKNELFGYYFDSLKSQNPRKMNVDSLLNEKAFKANNFYDSINDSLIIKIKKQENIPLIEKYIPKIRYDFSYPDTTIFYYSNKLKNLNYSFSKDLEKKNNHKISKVRMIYNEYFEEQYRMELPKREFLFELKEDRIKREDPVESLFKFYENLSKNDN